MFDVDNLLKDMGSLHLTITSDGETSCDNNEGSLNDEELADIAPQKIPDNKTHGISIATIDYC